MARGWSPKQQRADHVLSDLLWAVCDSYMLAHNNGIEHHSGGYRADAHDKEPLSMDVLDTQEAEDRVTAAGLKIKNELGTRLVGGAWR